MNRTLYGIYGMSGFGREVMPIARQELNIKGISAANLFFIDDAKSKSEINGQVVLNYEEFLAEPAVRRNAIVAIADSSIRKELCIRCLADGINLWSVISANVTLMDDVIIGEGVILSPFVTITSNVRIGKAFHANIYSYVAHDCIIGDYVTFAPGVKCNGNVIIEDGAYIGTGAIIKQGTLLKPLVIGAGSVVGMGAVVTKSVLPGVTVIGNPARPLTREGLRQ